MNKAHTLDKLSSIEFITIINMLSVEDVFLRLSLTSKKMNKMIMTNKEILYNMIKIRTHDFLLKNTSSFYDHKKLLIILKKICNIKSIELPFKLIYSDTSSIDKTLYTFFHKAFTQKNVDPCCTIKGSDFNIIINLSLQQYDIEQCIVNLKKILTKFKIKSINNIDDMTCTNILYKPFFRQLYAIMSNTSLSMSGFIPKLEDISKYLRKTQREMLEMARLEQTYNILYSESYKENLIPNTIGLIKGFELLRNYNNKCRCPLKTFMLFCSINPIIPDDPIIQMFSSAKKIEDISMIYHTYQKQLPSIYRTNIPILENIKAKPKHIRNVLFKNMKNTISPNDIRPICWIQFIDEDVTDKQYIFNRLSFEFNTSNLFFCKYVLLKLIDSTPLVPEDYSNPNIEFIWFSIKGELFSAKGL